MYLCISDDDFYASTFLPETIISEKVEALDGKGIIDMVCLKRFFCDDYFVKVIGMGIGSDKSKMSSTSIRIYMSYG